MSRLFFLILFGVMLVAGGVWAGLDPSYSPDAVVDTVPFYEDAVYDDAIPKPNDYLQHPIGKWPLRYHELVDYLDAVAPATGRIMVETHGRSYEGRTLYNVFISSEENLRNLESLREGMDRLSDGSEIPQAELDSLAGALPAFDERPDPERFQRAHERAASRVKQALLRLLGEGLQGDEERKQEDHDRAVKHHETRRSLCCFLLPGLL